MSWFARVWKRPEHVWQFIDGIDIPWPAACYAVALDAPFEEATDYPRDLLEDSRIIGEVAR